MVSGPWLSESQIVAHLQKLGVRPDGILLVHSSLSSLGYVSGGAHTVIRALLAAIGPDGTLVMPTHSWDVMEAGCREFDVRGTPSCVGAITEQFRKMPGVRRSLHPSHSVAALGPLAEQLGRNHEGCSTPCGEGTPYDTMLQRDGQILFLGTTLESNTAYHTIEALVDVPYLLKPAPDLFAIVDEKGERRELKVWRHQPAIRRRFAEWEGLLASRGVLKRGSVGPAASLLLEGRAFRDFMIDAVQRDPQFLLHQSV